MPAGGLVTAGVISGAASLFGAHHTANAAKKAAQEQQKGTDKALAVQREANQPYMDLGKAAAGRLGALVGNATPYTQQFTGAGGSNGYQAFNPNLGPAPAGPPPGSLGSFGGARRAPGLMGPQMAQGGPQMPPGAQMAAGQVPPPQMMQAQGGAPGGAMAVIESPDGERRPVPMALAQAYVARGGRIVG